MAEVVWVISHTKGNYLSAQYHRLARRIGKPKAIVAVSHSVLVIIYQMLLHNQDYHDLGAHFFATLDSTRQRDSAVRRLQALGYQVTLAEVKEVSNESSTPVKFAGWFPAWGAGLALCTFFALYPFPRIFVGTLP